MDKYQFLIDMRAVYDHYEERWNYAVEENNDIEEASLRGTMSIMKVLIDEIELGKYDS